ncbi:hypothetical protein ACVWXM_006292 [Bradyrhizobium sp. GM7.3]
MLKRFLLYGMPIYLLVAEFGIRSLLSYMPGRTEEISIILTGPTIAVGGLSLILPALTPKPVPLPPGVPPNTIVINRSDQRLIELAIISVFLLFLAWVFSLYLTHPTPPSNWALVIGLITYIIGIVFTEAKEQV